ncbi:hypothetical protein AGMMS50218_11460 [Actinomycetota bacterium]|nr:hypothetical protein AGMMS50218_11460 [Actinomycetota bacterium]
MTRPSRPAAGDGPHEPTTERLTPDEYRSSEGDYLIYVLHAATYDFALPYVRGKTVLDFGCGTGYGTAELAAVAERVVGLDIAAGAVRYAREHFVAPNLSFEPIPPIEDEALPFEAGTFDVVVSFQVVEHVGDVDRYLAEIRRVLRPDGVFLCVTPDRTHRLFPGQRPWNEFHVTEYSPDAFAALLRRRFADVEVRGMTARPAVLGAELRRYRRTRLLTYPVTFPGIPDRWRLAGVRAVKRLLGGRSAGSSAPGGPAREFGFGPQDVEVVASARPSVNVVAIASGRDPARVRSAAT